MSEAIFEFRSKTLSKFNMDIFPIILSFLENFLAVYEKNSILSQISFYMHFYAFQI